MKATNPSRPRRTRVSLRTYGRLRVSRLMAMSILFLGALVMPVQARSMGMGSRSLELAAPANDAFANATVGAVHALAYPLGTQFHVSHGGSNAVVLVPVMRFNMPEAIPLYAEIARAVMPELESVDDGSAADRLVASLETLIPEVGLEARLRDLGIREDDVPALADGALRQERLLSYNIKVPSRSDIESIYGAVL